VSGNAWISPDGRRLEVEEDRPGVVEITTEALEQLLGAAGFKPDRAGPPGRDSSWPPAAESTEARLPGVEKR